MTLLSRRGTMAGIAAAGGASVLGGLVYAEDHVGDGDEGDDYDAEGDDNGDVGAALRVGHFAPEAPNVDVYVDDAELLTDVAYDTVSDYYEVEPGTYSVTITAAGDPETVAFEGEVAIEDGYYTAAAIGEIEADTFEPLALEDESEAPDDAALVRLVHASPDAPAVDVLADDSALFEDASFGDATDYVEVEPGTYTLDVVAADAGDENGEVGDGADDEADDGNGVGDDNASNGNGNGYGDDNASDGNGNGNGDDNASNGNGNGNASDGHAANGNASNGNASDGNGPNGVQGDDGTAVADGNGAAADDAAAEPVASFDVEVEAGTAYTGYAIGYIDPQAAEAEADREFALSITVDGESAPEDDDGVDDGATDDADDEYGNETEMDDDEKNGEKNVEKNGADDGKGAGDGKNGADDGKNGDDGYGNDSKTDDGADSVSPDESPHGKQKDKNATPADD